MEPPKKALHYGSAFLLYRRIVKGGAINMELKIEYVPITEIKPYERNAKLHPEEQIEQIQKSIQQFQMIDPIGIWHGEVVEGHGRLEACKRLGYTNVPVVRLDHLTDEQRKAYALAHNKLTMNSGFDVSLLAAELDELAGEIDMSQYVFDSDSHPDEDETYTRKIDAPTYEITRDAPREEELIDRAKYDSLVQEIQSADIPQEKKDFLLIAAARHIVFNFKQIAEYYAHQDADVQELMERSGLVIIDFDKAIENGFVKLTSELERWFGAGVEDGA